MQELNVDRRSLLLGDAGGPGLHVSDRQARHHLLGERRGGRLHRPQRPTRLSSTTRARAHAAPGKPILRLWCSTQGTCHLSRAEPGAVAARSGGWLVLCAMTPANDTGVRPIRDQVLVRRDRAETTYKSLIHRPQGSEEWPEQ